MSFTRIQLGALLMAAGIGTAIACGPIFPWQLLDNRDATAFDPVTLSFPYEAARLATANDDLMPFGMTYTMRRSGQTWRIVVAAIHAPDGGPGR